jgi:GH25 family lysozyme M1 (1,4-beta-N-acetylmuramidase)
MTVVDLSKYQHEIAASTFTAWRSTVTRVILKCGGGDSGRYQDSLFDTNLANAQAAGMPVDAYWFNGTTDPVQDAIFAHSVIPKGMRIWWDVENEGSMPHWGDSSLNAAARQGQALGHPAGAYMSSSVTFGGWSTSNWMPLWVANYSASSVPAVGGGWKAVLWQYTSTGREPGYNGNLDISEIEQGFADLTSSGLPPITPQGDDNMPQNWNVNGTIVTIDATFAQVWTDPKDFSYLTNMAAWGAPAVKVLTPDQLTTIVNERNAWGAKLTGATHTPITAADLKPITDAIAAEQTALLAAIPKVAPAQQIDVAALAKLLAQNLPPEITEQNIIDAIKSIHPTLTFS